MWAFFFGGGGVSLGSPCTFRNTISLFLGNLTEIHMFWSRERR